MSENRDDVVSKSAFRMGILASIVASIIFISLIQPVMTYSWELISSTGNQYLNTFVDKLYKNAALGQRDWIIATFATAGVYIPIIITFSKSVSNRLFDHIHRSRFDENGEIKEGSSQTALFKLRLIKIASLVTSAFCATLIASYIYTDMQLNVSFNQRVAVLTPHITDLEYKQYRAEWASMKSKHDYQQLNNRLQKQADDLGIKLPEPLLND